MLFSDPPWVLLLASLVASPIAALPSQIPFAPPFNPLLHMSGIAPYHDAPGASIEPPPGCNVTAAAFLIRHSCIFANDDEYDDYMAPFISKVDAFQASLRSKGSKGLKKGSPLKFLETWKSPVTDDNLELLTKPGVDDAESFGKRLRELYGTLMPPKRLGKGKGKGKKDKVKTPFKIWTASSSRDIGTAKAWIRGAFPHWQEGDGGEGDGKYVSLIEVPNKDPDWAQSLTPHKICPAFTKEVGKPEAQEWLENFGPKPLARIQALVPDFGFELPDVIAMFMLCGYESVILDERTSRFCSPDIFHEHEFHAFGYWNDLKYHYQVGYGSRLSPYLGMGWLNTSTHNLLAAFSDPHPHLQKEGELPPPEAPPETEHTQLLFPYFTHREEPPVALVALGLWNTTHLPTDRLDHDRLWKTSRLLPFLGHVALERMSCGVPSDVGVESSKESYIRIIVNGAVQKLGECQSGPGSSCPLQGFANFVERRVELYHDFEGACGG